MCKSIERILILFILLLSVSQAQALQKVSVQLKWKNQFQFAGYYIAKEKGFYKDAGLDVDIKEYKDSIDIVQDVLNQKSTFGVSYPNIILEKSADRNIVLLYALCQSSPHVLVSLKSSDIKTIKDFENKIIMIDRTAISAASILSMLISRGIDINTLKIVKPSYDINSLIKGEVDITTAYRSNELYQLDKEHIPYNIWDPKNYGFDLYDDVLFTSQKELDEHPEVVKNFREASLKGFKYAFSHIDETADLILTKYNSLHKTKDALIYEAKVLKRLAYKGTNELGKLDKHKIQRIYDLYNLLGMTKYQLNLDGFIYTPPDETTLTKEETKYLKKKKTIKMCIDPDWMPFEKIKDGKHIGLSADYFKLFQKFVGVDIRLVPTQTWKESLEFVKERRCDIVSLAMPTQKRKEYLNFTKPYLKIPLVLATKSDTPFIANFGLLEGKKIAIPNGYAFAEILQKKYPKIKIVHVKNIEKGLEKVIHNEVFGYLGTLASIGYAFQNQFTGELKIAGKFDGTWDLGIGVRNDDAMLLEILQKAVKSVDNKSKQKILNNWLSIKYEKGTDYTLIYKTIAIFIIILIVVLYYYLKLNALKNKIQKQKDEIELLALTDSMTKLYNRRYFTQTSDHLLKLAKREKKPLSLIMIDIDDFKNINDSYGHKVGDDVIISISSILIDMSRGSDIACRFGGEEFVVLFPQTDIYGASVIAKKIKRYVEALKITADNGKIVHCTISIGLSEIDLQIDQNIEALLKRADDALYKAKRSGKNKICIKHEGKDFCLQDL